MLKDEFQYYIDHQAELLKEYNGKYLVIKDKTVVASYTDANEAYFKSMEVYEPGTFLIQLCSPGEQSYTQTFHSRVAFQPM